MVPKLLQNRPKIDAQIDSEPKWPLGRAPGRSRDPQGHHLGPIWDQFGKDLGMNFNRFFNISLIDKSTYDIQHPACSIQRTPRVWNRFGHNFRPIWDWLWQDFEDSSTYIVEAIMPLIICIEAPMQALRGWRRWIAAGVIICIYVSGGLQHAVVRPPRRSAFCIRGSSRETLVSLSLL